MRDSSRFSPTPPTRWRSGFESLKRLDSSFPRRIAVMKAITDFFIGEWYFSVPMTVMLIIAFMLVIWRYLLNLHANTKLDRFLPDLQQTLKTRGVKGAVGLCKQEKGLIPSVLYVAGLEASDQGVAAMRRSMVTAVELEILPRLN